MKTQLRLKQALHILFAPAQNQTALARVGENKPQVNHCGKSTYGPKCQHSQTLTGINLEDVTRIVLFELLERPCQYFKILTRDNGELYQVGRVVLVAYQLYGLHDPALPVPLIPLGKEFKKAYQRLAFALSGWVGDMFALVDQVNKYNAYSGYAHRQPARPRAVSPSYFDEMYAAGTRAIECASHSDLWQPDEWQFFCYEMRLSFSQPDRFTLFDNAQWREKWHKAKAANIALNQR
jgi:hypothetical protein